MTPEQQQQLADELEQELGTPVPEVPPPEATRSSHEALRESFGDS